MERRAGDCVSLLHGFPYPALTDVKSTDIIECSRVEYVR